MNFISLHSSTWGKLQAQRARLPHALLLIGQRGLGKFALAQAFAQGLLCESPADDGTACGRCLACNWFEQGNHPDYRLLQPQALGEEADAEDGKKKASQQITIDQVRGLDDFLNVGAHRAGLKVVVISPADAMNRNTANALLKTLEEPAPSTLFLLVSNEPLRLLPTIRSRCQVVPVSVPPAAVAESALAADGLDQPGRWLALAGGSPCLASELAAAGDGGWLDLLTRRLAAGEELDPLGLAAELEKFVKESKGRLMLRSVVEAMQKWLVDLTLAGNGLPVRYFLPQQATISGLADMIPPARIVRAYRLLLTRRREAEQPLNARLFLEGLFMDYRGLLRTERQ
ncbi:DNA polymerase III subunit delta' [Dechloromonas sp. H13]|uniref:DNA polymerase III subunit delta' n=1 Tax=Dechloromonas sp. H13 TaxID=2570193 RepID=UPI0012929233|nr:DNA polymerase III subunit delta' [Dechloromonas sp. H13]